MFAKNKEGKSKFSFAADSISTIAASMKILGDIEAEHDMRIDGHVVGNIFCKARVVLGKSGSVDGELHALNADVTGTVNGNVHVEEQLNLKVNGVVNGNITVGKLSIEPTATFNGKCTMSGRQTSNTSYVTEDSMVVLNN